MSSTLIAGVAVSGASITDGTIKTSALVDSAKLVKTDIITAANDFFIGTGTGTIAKKTLSETKTILGIGNTSETTAGFIELATTAEVTAGTDAVRAVTPATLKIELAKKLDSGSTALDSTKLGGYASTDYARLSTIPTFAGGKDTATEGRKIELAKSVSGGLAGNAMIDTHGSEIRLFENGGTFRGAYIDVNYCAAGLSKIYHSGISGHNNGINADMVDGYHASSNHLASGSWIPVIASGGVLEIGQYIDFHGAGDVSDYRGRIHCGSDKHLYYDMADGIGLRKIFHNGNYGVPRVWTASGTLSWNEENAVVMTSVLGTCTVTIPTQAAIAYPLGTQITLFQYNTGTHSVVPSAGVTLLSKDSKRTLNGTYASATLIKFAADAWVLVGNLV